MDQGRVDRRRFAWYYVTLLQNEKRNQVFGNWDCDQSRPHFHNRGKAITSSRLPADEHAADKRTPGASNTETRRVANARGELVIEALLMRLTSPLSSEELVLLAYADKSHRAGHNRKKQHTNLTRQTKTKEQKIRVE